MEETVRERLLRRAWKELYQLRCDQYCTKEEIVDDILGHDDGSVREMVQMEGSFLWLLVQSSAKKSLHKLLDPCPDGSTGSGQGSQNTGVRIQNSGE